jgi:hypothetical protein
MADEKKQLILDLLARNKMGPGTAEAARDIDHLGSAADKASRKTESLGKTSAVTSHETDKLGHSADKTKRRIADLDDEIRKSQRELAELAVAFHEAGSQADRLDISKAMRRTEGDIRRTTKAKGLLAGLLPSPSEVAGDGEKIGKSLSSSIGAGLAAGKQYAIGGAIALAAALAPEMANAISGAIVGGIGAGGLIGGVALAVSSDQKIKDYGTRIGQVFLRTIQHEARDAFSGIIGQDLGKVEALSYRASSALGKIFRNLAPSLDPFVNNLIRASDVLMGSFVNASAHAGPALKSLGNGVETISIHLGHLIDSVSAHSQQGASGIDFIVGSVTRLIDATGGALVLLGKFQQAINFVGEGIGKARNWWEDHMRVIDLTADGYKKGSEAAKLYREGIIGAAGSANDYDHYLHPAIDSTDKLAEAQGTAARAARGQRDALKELSDQLRAAVDPAFALLTAQDNLRGKQDALTEATKKYGSKSQQARSAARELATAAIDLQGAAGGLSAKFDGKLTPSMVATFRAAGLTEDQIAQVAGEFRRAAREGDRYAKTYRAKVITDYINRYSSLVVGSAQQSYLDTKKSLKKRASGGPVSRGTPYLVGENGPEVVIPSAAGRVLSAAGTRGMARTGAASAGWPRGPMKVELEVIGEERIRSFFRYMIRSMNLLEAA